MVASGVAKVGIRASTILPLGLPRLHGSS
jgi:hypothetical protein